MSRSNILILAGLLMSLPSWAEGSSVLSTSTSACIADATSLPATPGDGTQATYRPLEADQRLWYDISEFEGGSLEVRFFMTGDLYATELLDLSSAKLPDGYGTRAGSEAAASPHSDISNTQALSVELLSMHPDLVRRLHQEVTAGIEIEIEVFYDGHSLGSFTFEDLVQRSDALRASGIAPVLVRSVIDNIEYEGTSSTAASLGHGDTEGFICEYPFCNSCPGNLSCPTPCALNQGCTVIRTCGQTHPDTCVDPNDQCPCETVLSSSWSNWYPYVFQPDPPPNSVCVDRWCDGTVGDVWQRGQRTERRDLVAQVRVCPNCNHPTGQCVSCSVVTQIIDFQTRLVPGKCWDLAIGSCNPGPLSECTSPTPHCF